MLSVKEGQRVKKGDEIRFSSSAGRPWVIAPGRRPNLAGPSMAGMGLLLGLEEFETAINGRFGLAGLI